MPTSAPTGVLAFLSFRVSGVSIDKASTISFKQGVRKAVAAACSPPISPEQVGAITISSAAAAATAAAAARRALQSGSGVVVSTSVNAPAGSRSSTTAALQTFSAAALTTQLVATLGSSFPALSVSGVTLQAAAPTALPTQPPEDKVSGPVTIAGSVFGVVAACFCLLYFANKEAAQIRREQQYAEASYKDQDPAFVGEATFAFKNNGPPPEHDVWADSEEKAGD